MPDEFDYGRCLHLFRTLIFPQSLADLFLCALSFSRTISQPLHCLRRLKISAPVGRMALFVISASFCLSSAFSLPHYVSSVSFISSNPIYFVDLELLRFLPFLPALSATLRAFRFPALSNPGLSRRISVSLTPATRRFRPSSLALSNPPLAFCLPLHTEALS